MGRACFIGDTFRMTSWIGFITPGGWLKGGDRSAGPEPDAAARILLSCSCTGPVAGSPSDLASP